MRARERLKFAALPTSTTLLESLTHEVVACLVHPDGAPRASETICGRCSNLRLQLSSVSIEWQPEPALLRQKGPHVPEVGTGLLCRADDVDFSRQTAGSRVEIPVPRERLCHLPASFSATGLFRHPEDRDQTVAHPTCIRHLKHSYSNHTF